MNVSLFSIRSHATTDHVLQKSSGPLQLTGCMARAECSGRISGPHHPSRMHLARAKRRQPARPTWKFSTRAAETPPGNARTLWDGVLREGQTALRHYHVVLPEPAPAKFLPGPSVLHFRALPIIDLPSRRPTISLAISWHVANWLGFPRLLRWAISVFLELAEYMPSISGLGSFLWPKPVKIHPDTIEKDTVCKRKQQILVRRNKLGNQKSLK